MGYYSDVAVYVYAPEEEHNEAFAAWLAFNKESLFMRFQDVGLSRVEVRNQHGVLVLGCVKWYGTHVDEFMEYLHSLDKPEMPFLAWDMHVVGEEGETECLASENTTYALGTRTVYTINGEDIV
jgi:hypothetical protein